MKNNILDLQRDSINKIENTKKEIVDEFNKEGDAVDYNKVNKLIYQQFVQGLNLGISNRWNRRAPY